MSTLPGEVSISEFRCDPEASEATCSVDPCRNPLYAIDHPDDCASAPTLSGVRVEPENISIVAGRRGHVRVIALFSNGTEAEVTEEASLIAEDSGVAEVVSEEYGVVRGLAEGEAYIDGAYGGYTARATATILASTDVASVLWDVVFVLDLSAANHVLASRSLAADESRVVREFSGSPTVLPSYYYRWSRPIGDGASIDIFDDLILSAQLPLSLTNDFDEDEGDDRFALVVTGDGHPYTYSSFSGDLTSAPFAYAYPDADLGGALSRASSLLSSARASARKLVVIFSAGTESRCSPSARSVATTIKTGGAKVFVISPLESVSRTGTTIYSSCSYPETAYSYLQSLASPGCFAGGKLWSDVPAAFSKMLDDAF